VQPALLVAAEARCQVEPKPPPLEVEEYRPCDERQCMQQAATGLAVAELEECLAAGCGWRTPAQMVVAALVMQRQVRWPGRAKAGVELVHGLPHAFEDCDMPVLQLAQPAPDASLTLKG